MLDWEYQLSLVYGFHLPDQYLQFLLLFFIGLVMLKNNIIHTIGDCFRKVHKKFAVMLFLITFVPIIASSLIFLHINGVHIFGWQRKPVSNINYQKGFCYKTILDTKWMSSHNLVYSAKLYENGIAIGPSDPLHKDIREKGKGRYSFWHGILYFSTSDNTDPRENGRTYEIYWPVPINKPLQWGVYCFTLLMIIITGPVWLRNSIVLVKTVRYGFRKALKKYAVMLLLITFVPIIASSLIFLHINGVHIFGWQRKPVSNINYQKGFCYKTILDTKWMSSHNLVYSAKLYENGIAIGPSDPLHKDIREKGKGRYSFWHGILYFSTSDNTDPRENGRTYEIYWPVPINKPLQWGVYCFTLLMIIITGPVWLRNSIVLVKTCKNKIHGFEKRTENIIERLETGLLKNQIIYIIVKKLSTPKNKWLLSILFLIVTLTGGILFLRYDNSITYYSNFNEVRKYVRFNQQPSVQMPWFQYSFVPGEKIRLRTIIPNSPEKIPQGKVFFEIIGKEYNSGEPGKLIVNGHEYSIKGSVYEKWHRIYIDNDFDSEELSVIMEYQPSGKDASFNAWGTMILYNSERYKINNIEPEIMRNGSFQPLRKIQPELKPVPFRGRTPQTSWGNVFYTAKRDFFWRIGIQTKSVRSRTIGVFLLVCGLSGTVLVILSNLYVFIRHNVFYSMLIIIILVATFSFRLFTLHKIIEKLSYYDFGVLIKNGLWWDSGTYFASAMNSLSFSLLPGTSYALTVGFPFINSFLFHFFGFNPLPAKILHVVLQSITGVMLYYIFYNLTNRKVIAFLPMIYWIIFARPYKYIYFFLSETMAMFLLFVWICLLLKQKSNNHPYLELVVLTIVFAVSCFFRDIIVTLLPVYLLGIFFKYSKGLTKKTMITCFSFLLALLVWLPLVTNYSDGLPDNFTGFFPVAKGHIISAKKQSINNYTQYGTMAFIKNLAKDTATTFVSNPVAASAHYYREGVKFWVVKWGGTYERYMLGNVPVLGAFYSIQEYLYKFLLVMIFVGGIFIIFTGDFYLRWLVIFFYYVTFFHIISYSHFSGRPKAIYFPEIVLGGFLIIERFFPNCYHHLYVYIKKFFLLLVRPALQMQYIRLFMKKTIDKHSLKKEKNS